MTTYQAVFDYSSNATGMLSFRNGDKFTVKNRTNDDWWTVEDSKGEMGLVPVSYLEAIATPTHPQSGASMEGVFTALYDFTGQDGNQLSFKKGELLTLIQKYDVSWWTMQSPSGHTGLVPINYIDATTTTVAVATTTITGTNTTATSATTASTTTTGSQGNPKPHPHNGSEEREVLSEVLLSVDRAMQKIHDEATLQGGMYTPAQRTALQQLIQHRKSVVEENSNTQQVTNHHIHTPSQNSRSHTTHTHTNNSTPSPSLALQSGVPTNTSPRRVASNGTTGHSSPRPKRRAPAPPPNHASKKNEHFSSLPRKSKNASDNYHSQTLPSRDTSHRDRSRTQAPQASPQRRGRSGSHPSITPVQTDVPTASQLTQSGKMPPQTSANSPSHVPSSPQRSQHRRYSEQLPQHGGQHAVANSSLAPQQASTGKSMAGRSLSSDIHPHPHPLSSSPSLPTSSSSPSSSPSHHHVTATRSSSGGTPESGGGKKISLPPGLSPKSSPLAQRRHTSMTSILEQTTPPALPTQFPSSDGGDLIEVVRTRTQLSYAKSVQAVSGVLELLKDKAPVCADMMDGLLAAVQQSQANTSPSSARKLNSSSDMERLKEIFFQLRDVREDSQQRGWAVHDDLQHIMDYLTELLHILCDADQEITKAAVREDKYENILMLISYYDIESRIPIRLLMLQVFGVLCGLDREVISVLISSILPNELGRDINNHLTEIEKTLYSSTVCTMIFSTGEAVPLAVYDQWSESHISFMMDTIESPPDEDSDEQIPDAFLNVILSFNQHFTDPDTNLVMDVLKTKSDPRHFSEKIMFLINRGDDPVALQEPLCPDSLTKFALDVFSSSATSRMFYTTDLMVLIDIVLRQISDLCPGDELRSHYLELLYRIVSSTDYRSYNHRQKEITVVLNRIAREEGSESQRDHDVIRKIWSDYPGCFDEITDL